MCDIIGEIMKKIFRVVADAALASSLALAAASGQNMKMINEPPTKKMLMLLWAKRSQK